MIRVVRIGLGPAEARARLVMFREKCLFLVAIGKRQPGLKPVERVPAFFRGSGTVSYLYVLLGFSWVVWPELFALRKP